MSSGQYKYCFNCVIVTLVNLAFCQLNKIIGTRSINHCLLRILLNDKGVVGQNRTRRHIIWYAMQKNCFRPLRRPDKRLRNMGLEEAFNVDQLP